MYRDGRCPVVRLRAWTCGHPELTAPDVDGYAICVRCKAAFPVRLTAAIFDRAMEAFWRHG